MLSITKSMALHGLEGFLIDVQVDISSGMPSWEIKIKNENGSRKIIVVRDYGFEISTEQIKMNSFKTRTERNKEIYRLYHEEGLSQMFLANLFNMSQPSVSIIVNPKAK